MSQAYGIGMSQQRPKRPQHTIMVNLGSCFAITVLKSTLRVIRLFRVGQYFCHLALVRDGYPEMGSCYARDTSATCKLMV